MHGEAAAPPRCFFGNPRAAREVGSGERPPTARESESMSDVRGLHHVTAISGPAQENLDFYSGVLGHAALIPAALIPSRPKPSRQLESISVDGDAERRNRDLHKQ